MVALATEKEKIRKAGAEFAQKQIEKMFAKSKIVDTSDSFPKFVKEEIKLGKVLGKGGFGTVYECRGFDAKGSSGFTMSSSTKSASLRSLTNKSDSSLQSLDPEVDKGDMESRQFISDHCIRKGGDSRYALKILSKEVVDDPGMFIQGSIDMAIETRVLSDIEHPNIIKMRACGSCSPYEAKYFIVMDRLYDTMEKRITKWGKTEKRLSGAAGKLFDRKGDKKKSLLEEKMVAAFDLSAAILYLHNKNILYRDLKPENIGFDIRNDVKLFDFGLAKELNKEDQNSDGLYKLTAMTGSPRYMAPEVALEKPYSFGCDTYSFAIMLHQMYSCRTPFELYTMKALKAKVWTGEKKRPFIQDSWPVPVKTLLRRAWSDNIDERPSFQNIYDILRSECVRVRDGNDDGLEHKKRRSTFVFRGGTKGNKLSTFAKQMEELIEEDDEDSEGRE